MTRATFYYDFSSPYSYLAAERISGWGVPAGRASAAIASSLPAFCWMNFW